MSEGKVLLSAWVRPVAGGGLNPVMEGGVGLKSSDPWLWVYRGEEAMEERGEEAMEERGEEAMEEREGELEADRSSDLQR
ncbi:unnamed protein product [Pleuronectes platessa]|uniref:Uncharacterized protein n=1 Tax=Pleuronectes platessa TaxID=8262 RepID=A0A9N7ZCA4_PLEPL|nr:unnamed protein product [Pleuronectes platessa]